MGSQPNTTHTRTSTTEGPDYCAECSERSREWVQWPCPGEYALRCLRGMDPEAARATEGDHSDG